MVSMGYFVELILWKVIRCKEEMEIVWLSWHGWWKGYRCGMIFRITLQSYKKFIVGKYDGRNWKFYMYWPKSMKSCLEQHHILQWVTSKKLGWKVGLVG